jgi:hypothetical protein
MKNLSRLFLAFLITGILFSGCKDALDVTFMADYTSDLPIVVSPSTLKSTNGTFSSVTTIDPLSNRDMADYANNIQSIEILEVTGTILSVDNNAVLQTGTLSLISAGLPTASWTETNQPVQAGTVYTLGNDDGQLEKLSNILNSKNVFTVEFSGTTDLDDVTFTMQVFIRAKVVANPL